MARTRGERRYNTYVKTSARKALSENYWGMCSGKVSLNGEICACHWCDFSKNYNRDYIDNWNTRQIESFMKSIEE